MCCQVSAASPGDSPTHCTCQGSGPCGTCSGNPLSCDGKHTKSGIERSRTVVQVALSKRHGEGCPPSCFSEDDPIYFEVPLQQLLDFSCAFFTFINRLVIGFLTVAQLPWVVDLKTKTTCWGQAQQRMQPSSDILPIMASAVHIFWAALEIRCQRLVPEAKYLTQIFVKRCQRDYITLLKSSSRCWNQCASLASCKPFRHEIHEKYSIVQFCGQILPLQTFKSLCPRSTWKGESPQGSYFN